MDQISTEFNKMLEELFAELESTDPVGRARISLASWKLQKPSLDDCTTEEWLLYAAGQLAAQGFAVEMVRESYGPILGINQRYSDFLV